MMYKDKDKQKQAQREAMKRYRAKGITEQGITGQGITEEKTHTLGAGMTQGVMVEAEQVLTQAMLDTLPQGVVRPTGQPGAGFMPRVDWQGSRAYAQVIYDLLTMTVEELKARGQSIPNWKYHQATTTTAQPQGISV